MAGKIEEVNASIIERLAIPIDKAAAFVESLDEEQLLVFQVFLNAAYQQGWFEGRMYMQNKI